MELFLFAALLIFYSDFASDLLVIISQFELKNTFKSLIFFFLNLKFYSKYFLYILKNLIIKIRKF